MDFINEEFFRKIKKKIVIEKSLEKSVKEVLEFLKDNKITNWTDFLNISQFDKKVVDHLIEFESKNNNDIKEIRFYLRLELSNVEQLGDLLRKCEDNEEYEKCGIILKKITKMK